MADVTSKVELESRLQMCFHALDKYYWLLDSYVLDFFTENHIKKLPKSWESALKCIPLEEFYYLMNFSAKTQYVWPLSIICLRVLIKYLQLPRTQRENDDISLIQSHKIDNSKIWEMCRPKSACFQHPKLKYYFFKNIKPKKRYEIFKMANITAEIADQLNVKYIVDVGSGLGHLSRIMAYGFNLYVCSIETQIQFSKQAEMMDNEFEKILSKHLSDLDCNYLKSQRPVYLNQTIRFNLTADEFIKNVKRAFSVTQKNFKFGIVGLHPCGDLAVVLLKLYTDCAEAKFINLVGCCYHKLSTSSDHKNDIGFPLTQFSSQQQINMSYEARALACHAIESYCERLISRNYDHLKIHCYRAALESIIIKNWPEYRKSALSNVKSRSKLTFNEYCEAALKKLDLKISEECLKSEETLWNLSKWEDVVKFYSLRLMLAPLIETVILLDRKNFLLKKGFPSKIEAAFDPKISPRNQLLEMEPECSVRIVLLDFGHPMNTITIRNIINSLENILALSLTFTENSNEINFGILSLDSKLFIFQPESHLRKNYDLITKNLRASLKMTNGKVTVQEYKLLLRSSIETALYEFQGKKTEKYDNKSNNLLIQFAIITKKSASILDDILTDLTNKLPKNISNKISVENFKIVQILSELQEKTFTAPEKNSSIEWAFCLDDINDLNYFFKNWLLNPQHRLRILLSRDLNLEINCDVDDCILNPISFTFDKKSDTINEIQSIDSNPSPGVLKRVHDLEVTHRVSVNDFCPTLIFGIPRRIYATRSSRLNEIELRKNSKVFKELCQELRKTGQGLLAKSLISGESSELISFHFLTSDGDMLLMNDVTPDELYFPKPAKLSKSVDFSEDDKVASMIKICFQKIQFLDEYIPGNFSSGVYDYLKNYLTQVGQNQSLFRHFDSDIKLFQKKKEREENLDISFNTKVFKRKTDSFTSDTCEKRKKKPKTSSEKELQNVHPALLSPNIVEKYRKVHSQAFAFPELGFEYTK